MRLFDTEEAGPKLLDKGYSLDAFLRRLATVETVPAVAAPRYSGAVLHAIFDVDEDGLAEAAVTAAGARERALSESALGAV